MRVRHLRVSDQSDKASDFASDFDLGVARFCRGSLENIPDDAEVLVFSTAELLVVRFFVLRATSSSSVVLCFLTFNQQCEAGKTTTHHALEQGCPLPVLPFSPTI